MTRIVTYAVSALFVSAVSVLAGPITYTAISLGTLGGGYTAAAGINASGQVDLPVKIGPFITGNSSYR